MAVTEIAAAYGVRRVLILLANSALAINHWLLTIIGQVKSVLLLTDIGQWRMVNG